MTVGRPTLFDPSYCDKVVELGALGKSLEQIATILGVSCRVLYDWRDKYPEFLRALEQAKEAADERFDELLKEQKEISRKVEQERLEVLQKFEQERQLLEEERQTLHKQSHDLVFRLETEQKKKFEEL